jgi:hypothetical protein
MVAMMAIFHQFTIPTFQASSKPKNLKPGLSFSFVRFYSVSWLRIFCDSSWYWLCVMSPWFNIDLSSFSRATADVVLPGVGAGVVYTGAGGGVTTTVG